MQADPVDRDPDFDRAIHLLKNWRRKERNMDMDEIIPHLYLSGFSAARNAGVCQSYAIQAAVSILTSERDAEQVPVSSRLHIPLDDSIDAPLENYLEAAISFIHEQRMQSRNVLVHCLMGASRSPAIVVGYLMTVTDAPLEHIYSFVSARRYCAHPNYGFRQRLCAYNRNRRDAVRMEMQRTHGQRFIELVARDNAVILR